ncbi:mannose-1-phosphate guanylyltransferase/mannose-6-phosphate isomerase [Microbulbifer harenosus]|uniref:mannose-1-phosphate guanylyltransferase n=2 Tax=Microbulbifer harenosus TaxID=2576840 RepID=A0ABY2UP12_9GAMM|nr:mannose-1-phosphate guanylyltransferase/mannose-6-phosphate isomerase [Microbulbifer harenosus]
MAGGTGSRLWPASRQLMPKQFLNLLGEQSMLVETLARLEGMDCNDPIIICNEEHRFLAAEAMRQCGQHEAKIILEPEGRNTAPAIALAALVSEPDELLLVLAADHVIQDREAFQQAVITAQNFAAEGNLVAFGVVPRSAHTGYGYIKAESIHQPSAIKQFVEKPSAEVAEEYFASREYFWNSGMFAFRADSYIAELQQYRNDILTSCKNAMACAVNDQLFVRPDKAIFSACSDVSIDYAVMEQTEKAIVVPMDAQWSDVGCWASLWDVSAKDDSGNVLNGDVIAQDTKNCYIDAGQQLVATVGLDNIVVVQTKDTLLVACKNQVQSIKKIVTQLKASGRRESLHDREVYRPWGKYDSIDFGERDQVKRITVNPGAKLSVQMHHHRAEHWVVVSGTARVTVGEKTSLISENESTYIPIGVVHCLENPGRIPLEMIEVQTGSYLGEDDIVRFEDQYGRV